MLYVSGSASYLGLFLEMLNIFEWGGKKSITLSAWTEIAMKAILDLLGVNFSIRGQED